MRKEGVMMVSDERDRSSRGLQEIRWMGEGNLGETGEWWRQTGKQTMTNEWDKCCGRGNRQTDRGEPRAGFPEKVPLDGWGQWVENVPGRGDVSVPK